MWGFQFRVEGRPRPKPGESPSGTYRVVFPGYFATMRIPILSGRDVATTDRADAPPVVVINEFMAKTYWPHELAVGKRIAVNDSTWATVVGVAKNDVRSQLSEAPGEEMFFPFYQQPRYVKGLGASRTMTLVVRARCDLGDRSECDASRLATPVRETIRSIAHGAPISQLTTMTALVRDATAESRFYLVLLTAFAVIAMMLAAVGIYGVMSYSVSRKTHEIGIRIALGADAGTVVGAILRQGIQVAGIGAGVGLIGAFALTRLMRGILFGVTPTDAATFAAVTALLFAVAVVASLVPARRATRVDPLVALRSD